jgi:hypothetical protein
MIMSSLPSGPALGRRHAPFEARSRVRDDVGLAVAGGAHDVARGRPLARRLGSVGALGELSAASGAYAVACAGLGKNGVTVIPFAAPNLGGNGGTRRGRGAIEPASDPRASRCGAALEGLAAVAIRAIQRLTAARALARNLGQSDATRWADATRRTRELRCRSLAITTREGLTSVAIGATPHLAVGASLTRGLVQVPTGLRRRATR